MADSKDAWPFYHQVLSSFDLECIDLKEDLLRKIESTAVDLILLSYSLCPEEGLHLLKKIAEKTKYETPIILILERGQEKIAVAAMQDGATDYLTRDELHPAILVMSVGRAFEQKKWKKIYEKVSAGEASSSIKDPITGLYSVFYLRTRLDEEIQRSRRYHFPLTLLLFQIEQFSLINEHYGHDAGDHVLRELGQLFIRNLRSSDLLSRVRDDQFALLMPHTNEEAARTAWDRMIEEVKNHPFAVGKDNFYVSLQAVLLPLGADTAPIFRLLENVRGFIKQQIPQGTTLQLIKSIE